MIKKSARPFTKGEPVVVIQSWDGKGTVFYTFATVRSCGAKTMTLARRDNGEYLGQHYRPQIGRDRDLLPLHTPDVFKDMPEDAAISLCLEVGAQIIEYERAKLERDLDRISQYNTAEYSPGYKAAMIEATKKNLAELHEPRALAR